MSDLSKLKHEKIIEWQNAKQILTNCGEITNFVISPEFLSISRLPRTAKTRIFECSKNARYALSRR